MPKLVLHIGSNLGNRTENIARAIASLQKRVGVITQQSAIYKTAAWGVENQPDFLNIALILETIMLPEEVLDAVLPIELEIGRIRNERWGPRLIDIDIMFYNDWRIDYPNLTIPHPRIHERNFVLIPLAEIIPHFVHPVLGRTILELKETCIDESDVEKFSI